MAQKVLVIGAGLAGLVSARHLADEGLDVLLLEKRGEVGGRVRSTRRNGYVFDRGFQVFFTAYPYAKDELDYNELDLRYFDPGAQVARGQDVSTLSDPFRDLSSLVSTALNTSVTFGDKLRVFRLRRRIKKKTINEIISGSDTTIREYLDETGFSSRFIENFAEPFYGGITLDRSLSTSKKVFEFTFKMLTEGKTAIPANGMQEIPEQLASKARESGAEIQTGVEVSQITDEGDDLTVKIPGETIGTDSVIVATDAKEAHRLTGIESIPTEAHGCVTQYYDLGREIGMSKKIVLNAESDTPNQVVPISNIAPEYAPDGSNLVSATFLGTPDLSEDEFAARTQDAINRWYSTDLDLKPLHTDRISFAQFAQPPGIYDELPSNTEPEGNVFLAGDYTEASSINAAMASGVKAARAVMEKF